MTRILKRKTNLYKPTLGTINKMTDMSDKANQEQAEEVTLRTIIKKYGIIPRDLLEAVEEPLYLDMRGDSMTLNEKLKEKSKIDDYFRNLPAKVRKEFKDSTEFFYETTQSETLEKLEELGIFTHEHITDVLNKRNEPKNELEYLKKKVEEQNEQIRNLTQTDNSISQMQSDTN